MADISTALAAQRRIDWGRAIVAGLIATIVMTIVMLLVKMNIMKMLGSMIVGPDGSAAMQYAAGGAVHFMIGIIYGIIYAALVGRVVEWNRFIKGAVYGLAIAAIAFAAMPVMSAMMGGGGGAGNPCGAKDGGSYAKPAAANPCHGTPTSGKGAMNPCHPSAGPMNPCHGGGAGNPCGMKGGGSPKQAAANPCHGTPASGSRAMNPCHGKAAAGAMNACHPPAGPANPCHGPGAGNPCGGGSGAWSGMISLMNHLVYALTLAFVYGKVR